MLRNTFCHIPGVGRGTEKTLWHQGCIDWGCFLDRPDEFKVRGLSRAVAEDYLQENLAALEQERHQYFANLLGGRDSWRAWPDFRHRTCYLDIETDGGSFGDSVTTIGLFDGERFQVFVKGDNLESFRDAITHYSMIVTFYGTGFDLPMLKKAFPGLIFDQVHWDLCFGLRTVGYRGGLKKIEMELGIHRGEDTAGLDGQDAIWLWRRYLRGDDAALATLIAYNREDVVNLERLAEIAFGKLCAKTSEEAEYPPLSEIALAHPALQPRAHLS